MQRSTLPLVISVQLDAANALRGELVLAWQWQ